MSLILRLCRENDLDVIYKISNDPKVRQNAFNSKFINYEEHCKWYNDSLINKNRIMYIAEKDNFIIGQIRLDKEEDKAIISYSIEKNNRRKGYAKEILRLIKREAMFNDVKVLEGLVKKSNIASRKAFIYNLFDELEEETYFKYTYIVKSGDKIEINKDSK